MEGRGGLELPRSPDCIPNKRWGYGGQDLSFHEVGARADLHHLVWEKAGRAGSRLHSVTAEGDAEKPGVGPDLLIAGIARADSLQPSRRVGIPPRRSVRNEVLLDRDPGNLRNTWS